MSRIPKKGPAQTAKQPAGKADQPNLFGEVDATFNAVDLELTLVREEIETIENRIKNLRDKLQLEGGLYQRRDRLAHAVETIGRQRDILRPPEKKAPSKAATGKD